MQVAVPPEPGRAATTSRLVAVPGEALGRRALNTVSETPAPDTALTRRIRSPRR